MSKWQCVTDVRDEEVRSGRANSQNISAVSSDRRQRYLTGPGELLAGYDSVFPLEDLAKKRGARSYQSAPPQ